MALQRSHGRVRPVVLPPDELPSASPSLADAAQRDAGGRFVRGNTVQRYKLARPGSKGHAGMPVAPEFLPFQKWGRRYAQHRRSELAQAHGGKLSAGVSALVESAGEQLAASRYLAAKASTTGDAGLFKQASNLANDARQNELAAWELAAREAKAMPSRQLTGAAHLDALLAKHGVASRDYDDEDEPAAELPAPEETGDAAPTNE